MRRIRELITACTIRPITRSATLQVGPIITPVRPDQCRPQFSSWVRVVRPISINESFNSMKRFKMAASPLGEHLGGGKLRSQVIGRKVVG